MVTDRREGSQLGSTHKAQASTWLLLRLQTHFTRGQTTKGRIFSKAWTINLQLTIYTTKETPITINFTTRQRTSTDKELKTTEALTSIKRR